jgi:FkbM family methyltransferase
MGEMARLVLAKALHRLKTVRGGRLIANSFYAKAVCGHGFAVASLRCGFKAIVSVDDHVGRCMYLWGQHDPRIAAVIDAVAGPGDTVLDIGANFGVLGLLAAKKVGASGKVHLFEPQPLLANFLRTSLLINGLRHAEVHECALSDRSGYADMAIVEPENLGMTKLVSPADKIQGERIRVRVENAADYIESLADGYVSLVKIDVEGHEGIILRSLSGWMKEAIPGVVLFESHIGSNSFWMIEPVRVLQEIGYEFLAYDIHRFWKTSLFKISTAGTVPPGYDFVAVHPRRSEAPGNLRLQKLIVG